MSYNLVDPVTGDLTRVAGNSNIVDSAIETTSTWSSKKINDELDKLKNITRLTDFDEAVPEIGKNKIYYVNKVIDTYKCAQWRVESMYYDVSELKQYRGVQKATSINGVDNIMLMREYYLDDNNVMRWGAWQQLATMDKVDRIPLIYGQNTDILAYALTCPLEKRTLVRIFSANAPNNPFGVTSETDFIYEISKIGDADGWISIKAKDVRTNREFLNTKTDTMWLGWQQLAIEKDIQCFRTAQSDSSLWYAQQKFGCVAGTRYRVQLTLSSSSGAWMGIFEFNAVSQAGTFNPNTTTFVKCGGNIDIQGIDVWGTITHDGGFVCAMMQMIDPM